MTYTIGSVETADIVVDGEHTAKPLADTAWEFTDRPVLLAPIDGATGVSTTRIFDWAEYVKDIPIENPVYRLEVVEIASSGATPDWASPFARVVEETEINLRQELEAGKIWKWRVFALNRSEPETFVDDFDRATLGADWEYVDLQGTGSVTLDNGDLVITADGTSETSRQVVKLLKNIENGTYYLRNVRFSNVAQSVQPSFYFNTEGDFISNQQNGYLLFMAEEMFQLGKIVSNSFSNLQNRSFTRTANTGYDFKIETVNGHNRITPFLHGDPEPPAMIDHTDSNPYVSGGLSLMNLAFNGEVSVIRIGSIEVTYSEGEATTIDSVTVSGSTSDITEGNTRQFSASVSGSGNVQQSVTWSATGGSISSSGLFTAASGAGACSVTATSTQDGTVSDTVNFNRVEDDSQPADGSNAGDRQALATLFADTNGPTDWINTGGWSTDPNQIDLSGTIYGVQSEQVSGEWRVKSIKLNGNETIDPGAGNANTWGAGGNGIQGGNNLTGNIENVPFQNLTEMWYFNVKQNYIVSEVPSSLQNLPNIERIHLNGHRQDVVKTSQLNFNKTNSDQSAQRSNQFSGTLSAFTGPKLEVFECCGRGLSSESTNEGTGMPGISGPMPDVSSTSLWGFLISFSSINDWHSSLFTKDIHQLYMNRTAFRDNHMPAGFGNFVNMRSIDVEACAFGGVFPDCSNWVNIRFCWSARNRLTDGLPFYWIDGSNPSINMMEFAHNSFDVDTGLPAVGSNNLNAFTVDGTGNNFSGDVHESWGTSTTNMSNFGIGWNDFKTVPYDWSGSNNQRYLRFRDNPDLQVVGGGLPLINSDPDNDGWGEGLDWRNCNWQGEINPDAITAIVYNVDNNGLDYLDIRGHNFTQSEIQPLINALDGKNITFNY